ncbi:MAG: imidazole glycerol phosphate synthase subunit HisH [Coxiellaceae bacterium]|nr:imidazole glycerol phosphate synthase subunit HisH [Coxiellaceae bacterium]
MIAIVDYGLGNIRAFANIYKRLNIPYCIADSVALLQQANKIILPGVGAFDHAMKLLNNSGLKATLEKLVLKKKMPVLGICVGMQILMESSEEGQQVGLGWVKGKVKKIDSLRLDNQPLPHMGWNNLKINLKHPIVENLQNEEDFYFLHSYYVSCNNKIDVVAEAHYGDSFACVIASHNIYGMQCHPEKSHENGITFLKNFAGLP